MTETSSPARMADFPQRADALECCHGPNFSYTRLGKTDELMRYGIRHPVTGTTLPGKVFLHGLLDLTGMEISFGLLPPHTAMPFSHKHQQNEEVYLFLRGEGEYQVDGQTLRIEEGTAIRVAPDGARCWRNTGAEPLFYIVIQAKSGSLEQWTGTDGVRVPGSVEWPAAS